MKIAIFSDAHCGYAYDEERGEDSFIALEEAVQRSLDSDMILIAGDLFDSRIPRQEVLARTAKILSKVQNIPGKTKLIEIKNKEKHEVSPLALRGIPVLAIHGTHERRSRQMINPVQALEHAGLVIHLHCATAIFEIDGERIAVHGMSGVPEQYAKDVLLQWNPKPLPRAKNILMLHQSVEPYIYSPLEPPSLRLEDLPEGFDLYVLGHIHWHEQKRIRKSLLLLPGSLIPTSIHKIESEQQKGIFFFDGNINFQPLGNQRRIFYEEFEYGREIEKNISDKIQSVLENNSYSMKPIIMIKAAGKIKNNETVPNFSGLVEKFREKAIVKILQNLQQEELEQQVELMRMLREQKLSPEEQGLHLLRKNLEQMKCGIAIDEIFELLVDGNVNMIYNLLTGKQKTLKFDIDTNR